MTRPVHDERNGWMSRTLHAGVVALLLGLLVMPGASATVTAAEDAVPYGDLVVDGEQVPVRGSFAYHHHHLDENQELRGLVHGVRRVPGGTVLYYSIGSSAPGGFSGILVNDIAPPPYGVNAGWDVRLVDATNLTAYRPVVSETATFTTWLPDLDAESGQLRVAYAVFPELPHDTEAVQVLMPWGTSAGEIPVEEGVLEPVGDEPAPLVGQGWPQIADAAALASVDASRFTYALRRVSSDLQQRAVVEESTEQVDVALDANVLFEFDSAQLSAEAQATLAGVAQDIAARATGEVVVTGHTDAEGTDAYNQTLSEQRAQSVVDALRAGAGTAVTFTAAGRGEAEPVADNATPEGRAANRRVTVVYSIEGAS